MGLVATSLTPFCTFSGKQGCGKNISGQRGWCNNSFTVPSFIASIPLLSWEQARFQAADNAALHEQPPSLGDIQRPASSPAVLAISSPPRTELQPCLAIMPTAPGQPWAEAAFPCLQQLKGSQLLSSHLAYLSSVASEPLFVPTLYYFHPLQMIPQF